MPGSLYFEGVCLEIQDVNDMERTSTPVRIGDREKETFEIRFLSRSVERRHPVMDQLRGKKVRITIEVLP